ncbi:hypothetical protein [Mesonia sp. HuA40]|uniref:hypothetical protein n=1 Tax=Mesonia sp. HuA40 TaxID=2602761 RepID=UPI0011CC284A|nr:hypothetical protein [Mesonia sp. HuA40]TXK72610.1 hypothetical protein FT993_07195 [Mesonia sp. HuA40]
MKRILKLVAIVAILLWATDSSAFQYSAAKKSPPPPNDRATRANPQGIPPPPGLNIDNQTWLLLVAAGGIGIIYFRKKNQKA